MTPIYPMSSRSETLKSRWADPAHRTNWITSRTQNPKNPFNRLWDEPESRAQLVESHKKITKTKICKHCGESYVVTGSAANSCQLWCKTCNPPGYRSGYLREYDLSAPEFERMMAEQDRSCAICRTDITGTRQRKGKIYIDVRVDHDHRTGRVRGLLCNTCNVTLGHLEKPGFLEAAQAYLRQRSDTDG